MGNEDDPCPLSKVDREQWVRSPMVQWMARQLVMEQVNRKLSLSAMDLLTPAGISGAVREQGMVAGLQRAAELLMETPDED